MGSTGWPRNGSGAEMRKLLAAPDRFAGGGGHGAVGRPVARLPPVAMTGCFRCWWRSRATRPPDPCAVSRRLGGEDVAVALRLSRAEAQALARMRDGMAERGRPPGELGYRMARCWRGDILLAARRTWPARVWTLPIWPRPLPAPRPPFR